jgi:hypothetical protein
MVFIFHNILDVILPIDELIFFKMVNTTNQMGHTSGWRFGTWLDYQFQLGMSSSQLTFTPSFFRGVGQPPTRIFQGFLTESDGNFRGIAMGKKSSFFFQIYMGCND